MALYSGRMRYMVIETFRDVAEVYRRFAERGRMMPEGLTYLDSWISEDLGRCFQLMETDDADLFRAWIASWADLMEFEVVPVVSSAQARERALS